jgi:hypothetical protein
MKRVKIMLSAITVLAVVGGALAFKAQRFSPSAVFCSALDEQGQRICDFAGFQTVNNGQVSQTIPCGAANIEYYTTSAANCTQNGVLPANNKPLFPTSDSQ